MLAICAILLSPAWTTTALGENIQVGGGQRLNNSHYQVVHQETFDSNQALESIFWGTLDVGKTPTNPGKSTIWPFSKGREKHTRFSDAIQKGCAE